MRKVKNEFASFFLPRPDAYRMIVIEYASGQTRG